MHAKEFSLGCYSNFRSNLKSYMRQANQDSDPVLVTNTDPEDNVVVMSERDWNSISETLRVYQNPYLLDKVALGLAEAALGKTGRHDLIEP